MFRPWFTPETDWTAVDDCVRGGSSQSYLEAIGDKTRVRFYGTLDTTTLGGAGFASQTTTGNETWDLSGFDGLSLDIAHADDKMYTFIVKDALPHGKRDDGRGKSSINWEYEFQVEATRSEDPGHSERLQIPWDAFKPTYRGREKKDVPPLNPATIRRFTFMMRR